MLDMARASHTGASQGWPELPPNFRPSLLRAAPKRPPPAISGWHRKATYVRSGLLEVASFTSPCLSLWRRSGGEKKGRTTGQLEAPGRQAGRRAGAEEEERTSFHFSSHARPGLMPREEAPVGG